MDAELEWRPCISGTHMHVLDAFVTFNRRCQSRHAGVVSVGHTRQQDRNVQTELFGQCQRPSITRRLSRFLYPNRLLSLILDRRQLAGRRRKVSERPTMSRICHRSISAFGRPLDKGVTCLCYNIAGRRRSHTGVDSDPTWRGLSCLVEV